MENNEIYPIGTVVEVAQTSKVRLMIIGYNPLTEEGRSKDYVAIPYPVGCINNKFFFMINQDEIKKVIFNGYVNEEFVVFREHVFSKNNNTKNKEKVGE